MQSLEREMNSSRIPLGVDFWGKGHKCFHLQNSWSSNLTEDNVKCKHSAQ